MRLKDLGKGIYLRMKKFLKYHDTGHVSPTLRFFQAVRIYLQRGRDRGWSVYSGGPKSIRSSKPTKSTAITSTGCRSRGRFDSGDSFPASENACNPKIERER